MGPILKHSCVGAVVGVFFLHPVTMAIYWFEFNSPSGKTGYVLKTALNQIVLSFVPPMSPMILAFVLIGTALGFGSGWYYRELERKDRLLSLQALEIEDNIRAMIDAGEGPRLEFKSSLRWDLVNEAVNKSLAHAVLKTLAGFMNSDGGTLLLGVDDAGTVIGLDRDYATLKHPDRDGFQQHVMSIVASSTRADFCDLLHVRFSSIGNKDICAVAVEASEQPVYVRTGSQAKYFVRLGNATRELNTEEAVEHVARRFA